MKRTSDEVKLVNLALADEGWESSHRQVRNEGLAALRSATNVRRRCVLGAQIGILVIVCAAMWWSFNLRPSNQPKTIASLEKQQPHNTVPSRRDVTYINEEQMLAMFPKGSCVVAEINGETELVFFDASKAREGFEVNGN